ncbi:toxin of toxin-antitoxin system [Pedobacter psychrophilus]|uniref:Putative mRNA interferase YoeB n=1 Tax=Pedobacter psychrophilus TaxID=1826909 RepID=A0A179DHL1_9SPHI|nr:Txe/YoeB family addiction module toxin [Pedobacter psychrophilus]OAQ39913.1 toxin of toxin-antitoxin system [Pedobacter psychrophilus]
MEIIFHGKAKKDFDYWKKSGNKSVQIKIEELLRDIISNPFQGIGKPEQLKYELSGQWSRRINNEHRIIYDVDFETINVYSLKGHYNK